MYHKAVVFQTIVRYNRRRPFFGNVLFFSRELAGAFTGLKPVQVCWAMLLKKARQLRLESTLFQRHWCWFVIVFFLSMGSCQQLRIGLSGGVLKLLVESDIIPWGSMVNVRSKVEEHCVVIGTFPCDWRISRLPWSNTCFRIQIDG